jgi:hypothetical protein
MRFGVRPVRKFENRFQTVFVVLVTVLFIFVVVFVQYARTKTRQVPQSYSLGHP